MHDLTCSVPSLTFWPIERMKILPSCYSSRWHVLGLHPSCKAIVPPSNTSTLGDQRLVQQGSSHQPHHVPKTDITDQQEPGVPLASSPTLLARQSLSDVSSLY